ncbi:MAG: hypothetical protein AAF196_20860 [Planctomycetota bacterium]
MNVPANAIRLAVAGLALSSALSAQVSFVNRGQTLAGDPDAIEVSGLGAVINNGTIDGVVNGVEFVNGLGSGFLLNFRNGVIRSDSRAVNIGGQVFTINRGDILGTGDQRNGTFYSDAVASFFSLENSGRIDAGAGNQGSGVGIEVSGNNTSTIFNTGRIQGRTNTSGIAGNSGLSGDGLRIANFTPTSSGEIRRFGGWVFNTGSIRSESMSGTIAGFRVANGIDFAGAARNGRGGEIFGPQNGVYFGTGDHTGGTFRNDWSGEVSSDSRAFNIDGTGLEIENFGEIFATGIQRNGTVYADSTAQEFVLRNQPVGVIDAGFGLEGAAFSVELSELGNDFTIENRGVMLGRGDAAAGLTAAGDGIRLERTRLGGVLEGSTVGLFTGTIENSGALASEGANGTVGGFRAVNGVSFQGELKNSGDIFGPQNGVYFGNPTPAGGGDHTGGVVNNEASGAIRSDSRAFNLDGTGLTVNNTGEMLATGRQRNGTFYVDGTGDNFLLDNQGTISAEGGAGSGVSIQVGSFDGDVQVGAVTNCGEILGFGDQELDAGVRLFTNAPQATFAGNIVNAPQGLIAGGENSAGVLVQDGVVFDGALINKGEIEGGIEMASGDLVLVNSSVITLEVGGLNDGEFQRIQVGGNATLNGTLHIVFVDGFNAPASDFADLTGESFLTNVEGAVLGLFDRILVNGSDVF